MQDFRVTFSKTDMLIYTSHLDLQRNFVRVFNRAGLNIKCTEGFNPHPKVVFALPLSLGMEGKAELVDFSVNSDEEISEKQLLELLNKNMPKGLCAISACTPVQKFKYVKSADYTITLLNTCGIVQKVKSLLDTKPLNVIKKVKDGQKVIEISSGILKYEVKETQGNTIIDITLTASADKYINPECIVNALTAQGIFEKEGQFSLSRNKINFEE